MTVDDGCMSEPMTVAEVIERLRRIDEELPAGDGVAEFNRVYLEVTEHVGGLLAFVIAKRADA